MTKSQELWSQGCPSSIFVLFIYLWREKYNKFLKGKPNLDRKPFFLKKKYFKDTFIPAQMVLNKCSQITYIIKWQGQFEKSLKVVMGKVLAKVSLLLYTKSGAVKDTIALMLGFCKQTNKQTPQSQEE